MYYVHTISIQATENTNTLPESIDLCYPLSPLSNILTTSLPQRGKVCQVHMKSTMSTKPSSIPARLRQNLKRKCASVRSRISRFTSPSPNHIPESQFATKPPQGTLQENPSRGFVGGHKLVKTTETLSRANESRQWSLMGSDFSDLAAEHGDQRVLPLIQELNVIFTPRIQFAQTRRSMRASVRYATASNASDLSRTQSGASRERSSRGFSDISESTAAIQQPRDTTIRIVRMESVSSRGSRRPHRAVSVSHRVWWMSNLGDN